MPEQDVEFEMKLGTRAVMAIYELMELQGADLPKVFTTALGISYFMHRKAKEGYKFILRSPDEQPDILFNFDTLKKEPNEQGN